MDKQVIYARVVTQIKHNSITPSEPVRVCAYVRVSTSHDEQLNSLQSQTEYYSNKFDNNPGYVFLGVYSDAGISGSKENRPGFQAILEKARAGELDLIHTKSISRFARNTLMLLQVVRELKSIGVGIVFEEENIHTLKSEGELMLSVLAGIAEEERKSVRSNVQWAMRSKCLRGEVMVNTDILIGFGKDDSGKLIIIPEQAKVVQELFRMYLDGTPAYKIVSIFNEQGTPSFGRHNHWSKNRVLSIISNEKYMGAAMMQKSFIAENGKQLPNRGQRDRYWVEDDHPAIVSRADWDRAQLIRKKRVRKTYPFSGLLRCSYCGSSMIRVKHNGGYVSWICSRYLHERKSACIGARITEPRLIEITKGHPITEPTIIEEVYNGQNKRKQKDYRLTPVSARPEGQQKD